MSFASPRRSFLLGADEGHSFDFSSICGQGSSAAAAPRTGQVGRFRPSGAHSPSPGGRGSWGADWVLCEIIPATGGRLLHNMRASARDFLGLGWGSRLAGRWAGVCAVDRPWGRWGSRPLAPAKCRDLQRLGSSLAVGHYNSPLCDVYPYLVHDFLLWDRDR